MNGSQQGTSKLKVVSVKETLYLFIMICKTNTGDRYAGSVVKVKIYILQNISHFIRKFLMHEIQENDHSVIQPIDSMPSLQMQQSIIEWETIIPQT